MSVFIFIEVLPICTLVIVALPFLLENRHKWSVYENGDVRLPQWNKVVVFKAVLCLPNRSWFAGHST